jgi:phosphate transport system substrate-binding protein
MKLNKLVTALGLTAALASASALAAVDGSLSDYEKVSGISGNLSSVGSDTLANMMTLWAEEFKRSYPNVNVQIQAAGSSTAPAALTEGTAQFGPMSRAMKDNEDRSLREALRLQADAGIRWPSMPWRCSCTRTTPSRA